VANPRLDSAQILVYKPTVLSCTTSNSSRKACSAEPLKPPHHSLSGVRIRYARPAQLLNMLARTLLCTRTSSLTLLIFNWSLRNMGNSTMVIKFAHLASRNLSCGSCGSVTRRQIKLLRLSIGSWMHSLGQQVARDSLASYRFRHLCCSWGHHVRSVPSARSSSMVFVKRFIQATMVSHLAMRTSIHRLPLKSSTR
jgi:hypothetical protein